MIDFALLAFYIHAYLFQNIALLWNTTANSSYPLESNDITVVTAFFDIGAFGKGTPVDIRTPNVYFQWAQTFKYLVNPLVVYTDSHTFYNHMAALRRKSRSKTRLFMYNRNSSWAFQMKDAIKEIYNSKHYPKHFPNTVVPEYTCAMHAKFDVISMTAMDNFFNTKYFMWLDIGYFRHDLKSKLLFRLELPPDFNDSRIAANQVFNVKMSRDPSVIIKGNFNWIGGGLFLGRRDVMLEFADEYKTAVNYFLSNKLMNTEQQLLYAMYSDLGRKVIKPDVELQTYHRRFISQNPWFYLGYLMKEVVNSSML